MPYLGETCALSAAVCWTGSSTAFAIASRAAGARAANQFRLVVAVPVLVLLAWSMTGSPWPEGLDARRWSYLVGSGLVGLTLGDIAFFHALATIGPRLSSVVFASWPGMTVVIEAACGRMPGTTVVLGVVATMVGVGMVLLRAREGTSWQPGLSARAWWIGMLGAFGGALGQAGGYALAGEAMAPGSDLPAGVLPLHASVVRMAVGLLGLQAYLMLQREGRALVVVLQRPLALRAALFGAACGPVAGVWLSMIARRHAADSGVAAALMSTTPIFMMPVAAWTYGARIGWLGALGTFVTVGGLCLCLIR